MECSLFMAQAGENAGLVEGECKDFGTGKTTCQLVKVEFEVGGMFGGGWSGSSFGVTE